MYAAQQTNQICASGAFGVAAGQAAMLQDVAARQLEIPAGLERLDRQVAGLAEYVQMLDDRLTGTVARSHAPSTDAKGGALKAATQCGMGGHLDALGDHVHGLRERLGSLIDRLEF